MRAYYTDAALLEETDVFLLFDVTRHGGGGKV